MCVKTCPSLWIAYPDPIYTAIATADWKCVRKCPTGWYLKLENRNTTPTCVDTCATGWQDEDLN
jgi:hypothetical protein